MQNTIEQLNFEVILNTKQFDDTIKSVEERAKNFNTSLSKSLDIQKNVEKTMSATAKASAKAAAEKDKEAQSFSKYIDQLKKMEDQGQRLAEQMPKAFNWSHHIDQTYLELNRLMGILQKVKERQESGARIQYSDEYINKITAAGEGALRAITALEEAQKRLTAPNNGFQEHIRNLTETNTTLLQMREHYSALEKDSQRAAKETEKMYSSQAKATKEAQKQLPVGRSMEGMAAERAAIEKRIAENLANEGKELNKVAKSEGTRASESKKVADAQKSVNKLIEEAAEKQRKHTAEVARTSTAMNNWRKVMSTISQLTGVYFGAMGIRRFVSSMIEITGQFELQKVALKTILRDAKGAEIIFEQLYRFSSDSMYRFSELAKHAKQLAAFGIGQDNLLDTTKMLGDVAAGLGISIDKIILAYGHVKSSGFLRGIQLRSFSQNGVPILQELADMMTEVEGRAVSLGEVFDRMTKRQIDFAMVEEAFRRMTAEGGQFHGIQEQMARTLAGEINVLKGRWENLMYAMGEETEGFIITIVRAISQSISSLESFKNTLGDLWDAGSPVWKLYHEMREWIGEANRNKGKGGKTDINGGGFAEGFGVGGGSRGGGLKEQEEIYLRVSDIVSTIKTEEAEIYRLRKKAQSEGLSTGILGGVNEEEALNSAIEARDAALKQYKQIMGVDYYKTGPGGKKVDEKRKETINSLKDEAALIRKLADAYAKLEPYLGKETNAKMVSIFGEGDYSKDNLERQVLEITDALRQLGKEGIEAANSIEQTWELDKVSQAVKQLEKDKKASEDAKKALDKYLETYRKWASEDFNLGGTGFEFDIRKALSDLNTKYGKIDEKYLKAIEDAEEAYKGDAAAIAEAREQLEALRDAEKEYERAKAQESLGKLASSYLKEQYLLHNINFDDLGHKTVGQLRRLKNEVASVGEEVRRTLSGNFTYLESLISSWGYNIDDLTEESLASLNERLPESSMEMLRFMVAMKKAGLTVDDLGEKINSALRKGLKDLDDEEKKALASFAKYTAKQIISLADSFERLGEATENAHLAQTAKDFAAIAKTVQAAAEGFKTGGWIGAIVGTLVSVTDQIVNAAAVAAEKERELRDAIRDVQKEVKAAHFDNILSNGVDSIFGSDFVGKIRNAVDGLSMVREQLKSLDEWMKKFREDAEKNPLLHQGGMLYPLFGEGAENTLIHTKHSRWRATDEYATIENLAKQLGYESVNDKYGNLNPELLEDILELYGDLNEELKDWLVNSAEYSREYAKAMEQIEEATKSVFDNLASDMADKFIDNFLQMGNAVDDLSDTFANLGDAILRSFLQSYILEEILNKYTEDANEALRKYANNEMTPEDYAAWLDGFADNIQKESETLAPAINGMIEAFKDRGLMNIDEDTANSLGSGIKGITEDTANLLASYINAMRADLSSIRMMQESGWQNISSIGSAIPTLNEYMAQVAANTFDSAQNTQRILSELQSVIGPAGTSGMVVRVEGF